MAGYPAIFYIVYPSAQEMARAGKPFLLLKIVNFFPEFFQKLSKKLFTIYSYCSLLNLIYLF